MNNKPFEFHGTAGGYFVVFIVTIICIYIPFFGWPFAFNFTNNWLAENGAINGRKIKYSAGYWESFKFLLVNMLLLIVTLGIYTFWFVPKEYRYIVDHAEFVDEPVMSAPQVSVPVDQTPIAPVQQTPSPMV